ncbi:hypothetical protein Q7I34_20410, partial [Aeromonas veronii]|uniref:hypothetical protein n=1 Tax=Aeromonas veronii TaxID=654 RepID=UPI0030052239
DTLYPPPVFTFRLFRLGDNYSDTGGEGADCKIELKKLYDDLISLYKDYVSEIAKPEYQLEEDINIFAEVAFYQDQGKIANVF